MVIVINNYKSYDQHVEKLSFTKQLLLVVSFVFDIPFKHTFCNDHIFLTFCVDFMLSFHVPTFFSRRVVEALVLSIALFTNLLIRGYLYFDQKVGVLDLVGNILIIVAIRIVSTLETSEFLVVNKDRQKDITVKNDEFQSILNTFPEGVFMASYKDVPNEEEQVTYLP